MEYIRKKKYRINSRSIYLIASSCFCLIAANYVIISIWLVIQWYYVKFVAISAKSFVSDVTSQNCNAYRGVSRSQRQGGLATSPYVKIQKQGGRNVFICIDSAPKYPRKHSFFRFCWPKKTKFSKPGGSLRPTRPPIFTPLNAYIFEWLANPKLIFLCCMQAKLL